MWITIGLVGWCVIAVPLSLVVGAVARFGHRPPERPELVEVIAAPASSPLPWIPAQDRAQVEDDLVPGPLFPDPDDERVDVPTQADQVQIGRWFHRRGRRPGPDPVAPTA